MAASLATLLETRGFSVMLVTCGGGGGDGGGGGGGVVEVIQLPIEDGDPFYDPVSRKVMYLTPSSTDGNSYDIISPRDLSANHRAAESDVTPEPALPANQRTGLNYDAILSWSRNARCKQILLNSTWLQEISRVKIFATILDYHDLCTLTIGRQLGVPVVGVVTSRTWAWWAWHWLGVTPSLATEAVPPNLMSANFGFLERLWNIWHFWRYISNIEKLWVDPLMATLPPEQQQPMGEQYDTVNHVMVAWDWLTDPGMPRSEFISSLFGLQFDRERQNKDLPLSPQRARNGVVLCNLRLRELWVGMAAQRAILRALATTPFYVMWRGLAEAQEVEEGEGIKENKGKASAILDYQEELDIDGILAHPRHKLMISMCGETEGAAAILFGSPVLCVPVSPDQFVMAGKLMDLGLALVIPARDVSTNQIRDAILQLTTNRKFRTRGRELAEAYLSKPLSPADLTSYHLDTIINRPMRRRRGVAKLSGSPYWLGVMVTSWRPS